MSDEITVTYSNYDDIVRWAGDSVRTRDHKGVWIITPERDVLAVFGDTLVRNEAGGIEVVEA